ncbi:DnaD/phage-associated family protein [Salirhabdus euzebyi]|uniref:DnaD/phage-associated family protein n=1 Tax=Salirhabdus euzebyi TaxID=394506 RepID=A0A841PYH0_9BACI|nr:DnaD domain protein [Salirhabdus euzebyi]MBB6452011.1 DnaD/phage-associated family protein [Salirhabdus euzebyi]
MHGWVKLHRELMEKAIWLESTPEQKTILITLLMMANHKEKEWEWKGERFKAEPGQFVTSLEKIAQKSGRGISVQNVRTAIKRFEKYDFLTNKSTNKNRLITIVNWCIYQEQEEEPNKQTNKQLTSSQQATNKQLTTNKNVKNDKNDKKLISSSSGDEKFAELMNFYRDNLQKGISESPFNLELLIQWYEEWGDELLLGAMQIAAKKEAKGISMIEGILKNWKEAGVKSLDDARRFETKFKTKNKSSRGYGSKRPEVLPDWFKKQDADETKKQPKKKTLLENDAQAIELAISFNKDPMSTVPSLEHKYGITSADIQRVVDKEISAIDLLKNRSSPAV